MTNSLKLTKGQMDRLRQVEAGEIFRAGGRDVSSSDFFTRRGYKSAGVRSVWIGLTRSGLIKWVRVGESVATTPKYVAALTDSGVAQRGRL